MLSFVLALTATCSPVDYSAELGPARHQAETGWCYAHTAADLVSQHLKTRVSAVDLATTYLLTDLDDLQVTRDFIRRTEHWRLEDPRAYSPRRIFSDRGLYFNGGLDQDAIFMSHLKGFCADQELPGGPAEFKHYMRLAKEMYRDSARRNECLIKSRREVRKIGSVPGTVSQDMARVFQCVVDDHCRNRLRPARPVNADTFEFAGSLEAFEDAIKRGKIDRAAASAALFAKADELLDQGKIMSIGWDAGDLYEDSDGADHASLIVGRKSINGVCHYRLRDSYGDDDGIWFTKDQMPSLYGLVWIR